MKIQAAMRMLAHDSSSDVIEKVSQALDAKPRVKGSKVSWSSVHYDASLDKSTKTLIIEFSDAPTDRIESVGNTWEEVLDRLRNQASSASTIATGKAKDLLDKLKSI